MYNAKKANLSQQSSKVIAELMTIAWEMENTQGDLERSHYKRIEPKRNLATQACAAVPGMHRLKISYVGTTSPRISLQQPYLNFYKRVWKIEKSVASWSWKLWNDSPIPIIYQVFTNPASTSFDVIWILQLPLRRQFSISALPTDIILNFPFFPQNLHQWCSQIGNLSGNVTRTKLDTQTFLCPFMKSNISNMPI